MRRLFSFCFSFTDFQLETVSKAFHLTFRCLASVAENVNELMKTKFNISSVFSAEKINGNSAKQLL